jgi:uncharacterized protein (TIGR03067 family)
MDAAWSDVVMKSTITAVLCGAAIATAGCSQHQKSDVAALQGTWNGPQIQKHVNPEHQCSLIISGNNYEFQDDADTNAWNKGTFTLKEDTEPRQYIFTVSECHIPKYVGSTIMAIYRLEGGTLTITWNAPGNPAAPSAFDAPGAARMELKQKPDG